VITDGSTREPESHQFHLFSCTRENRGETVEMVMGNCSTVRFAATEFIQNRNSGCWKLGNPIQQEFQQENYRVEQHRRLPQTGIASVQLVDHQKFILNNSPEVQVMRSLPKSRLGLMSLHRICKFSLLVGNI